MREIQAAATDSSVDISTVLRKAKILAARLQNEDFEAFNQELNGYEDVNSLPPCRILPVMATADLSDGYRFWNGAPVMASFLPEKLKWWAETSSMKDPIAAIASMAESDGKGETQVQVRWPQELAVKYGAKGYNNFECLGARQIIGRNALVGLVDSVRNRILEFALKIEKENPDAGEAPVNAPPVPPEKLEPIVHNIFYGNVGNVAQASHHVRQTATINMDSRELARLLTEFSNHIDELNLDKQQRLRAEAQIAAIQAELAGDPDPAIVQHAGRSLRSITEGVIGSLIANAAPADRLGGHTKDA
ncbi:MAG: hypothetical protein H7Y20_05600 [Bryobacteraceae bacterium]|nr:hypothetical protein [Bryobacteraceae bacterium]